jgi:hypothetical protein
MLNNESKPTVSKVNGSSLQKLVKVISDEVRLKRGFEVV